LGFEIYGTSIFLNLIFIRKTAVIKQKSLPKSLSKKRKYKIIDNYIHDGGRW